MSGIDAHDHQLIPLTSTLTDSSSISNNESSQNPLSIEPECQSTDAHEATDPPPSTPPVEPSINTTDTVRDPSTPHYDAVPQDTINDEEGDGDVTMKDVESISQGAPSQESTISITDSNANANANSQSPISDIKEQEEKQNQSPTSASQQATRVILPSSVPVNNETPDTLVGPEDTNKDISVAPHTNGHGILSNNTPGQIPSLNGRTSEPNTDPESSNNQEHGDSTVSERSITAICPQSTSTNGESSSNSNPEDNERHTPIVQENIYRARHSHEEDIVYEPNRDAQPVRSALKRTPRSTPNSDFPEPGQRVENDVSFEIGNNTTLDDTEPGFRGNGERLQGSDQDDDDTRPRRVHFDLPDNVPADQSRQAIYVQTQRERIRLRRVTQSLQALQNHLINSNGEGAGSTPRRLVPPAPIRYHKHMDGPNRRLESLDLSVGPNIAENGITSLIKRRGGLKPIGALTRPLSSGMSLIPRAIILASDSQNKDNQSEEDLDRCPDLEDDNNSDEDNADRVQQSSEGSDPQTRQVGYACSKKLIQLSDKLPSNIGRAVLVHTLIYAYKLFKSPSATASQKNSSNSGNVLPQCEIVPVVPLTLDQLVQYHDKEFMEFIFSLDRDGDLYNDNDEEEGEGDSEVESDTEQASPNGKRLHSQNDVGSPSKKQKITGETYHAIPKLMQHSFKNLQPSNGRRITTKLHRKYEQFGLEYDCPYFEGISEYVMYVAGASVACADYILKRVEEQEHSQTIPSPHLSQKKLAPVAINWQGGRHHARKSKASGFCYVNDIVLCIQKLRTKFSKVFYLDLDLHHGDGVETAFARSSKVAVMSVHRYDTGFYPGSKNGSLEYQGGGTSSNISNAPGVGYTINIPTKRGFSGTSLERVFKEVIDTYVTEVFEPDCVVVTVGCDGLARDEHREWNLSVPDYESVIRKYVLEKWNLPTVFLGGGGYHHTDTARCWTFLTASILGRNDHYSWDDIPEHSMLNQYKNDAFQFKVQQNGGVLEDENEGPYLDNVISTLQERFKAMKN